MRNIFKQEVKALYVLHTGFLVGQIIFLALIYFMGERRIIQEGDSLYKTIQLIVAVSTIVCVAASFFVFKLKVNAIQLSGVNVSEKLIQYKKATLIKFSLLEAAYLCSTVAYNLTGNIASIILASIIIVFFAAQRPTIPMLMYHLQVSRDDLFEEAKL